MFINTVVPVNVSCTSLYSYSLAEIITVATLTTITYIRTYMHTYKHTHIHTYIISLKAFPYSVFLISSITLDTLGWLNLFDSMNHSISLASRLLP